jgi:hypothetical protein
MTTDRACPPPACETPARVAYTSPDRWYVLGVLTLVYALNIAERFSISTMIEPIRLETHLTDGSVAFLTGVAGCLERRNPGAQFLVPAPRESTD